MDERTRRITLPAAGLALFLGAGSIAAQDASVPTADAQVFLGEWLATLEGPQSPIELRFDVVDDGGQVVGQVSRRDGKTTLVEEFTMSGSDLLLSYRMDFGGQGFRVALSLTPDGEDLNVRLTGGGGTFTGTATRVVRRRESRPPA